MKRCLSCGSLKPEGVPCPGCLVELGLLQPRIRWMTLGIVGGIVGTTLIGMLGVGALAVAASSPAVTEVEVASEAEEQAYLRAERFRAQLIEDSARHQREMEAEALGIREKMERARERARREVEAVRLEVEVVRREAEPDLRTRTAAAEAAALAAHAEARASQSRARREASAAAAAAAAAREAAIRASSGPE